MRIQWTCALWVDDPNRGYPAVQDRYLGGVKFAEVTLTSLAGVLDFLDRTSTGDARQTRRFRAGDQRSPKNQLLTARDLEVDSEIRERRAT